MSATVYSTTGTAPIEVMPYGNGNVFLTMEDGSGQVYRVSDLLVALGVEVRPVTPVEVVPGLSIEIPTDLLADLTDEERVECIEAARREVNRRATGMRIWRSRQAEHEETRRRHRPVIEGGNVVEVRPDVQPVPSDVLYLGQILEVDMLAAPDEAILSRSVGIIISGEAILNGSHRRVGMRYMVTDGAAQAIRDAIEAARACGDLPDSDLEDVEP